MMILVGRPVVYRNQSLACRISAVDGTAFLDACAALVPYADGSHLVEIYDASGRMLRGYLGAAGTGETYDSNLISSWANSVANPYETLTTSGADISSAINSSNIGITTAAVAITAGRLYRFQASLTINSGVMFRIGLGTNKDLGDPTITLESSPVSGTKSLYITATDNAQDYLGYSSTAAVNFAASGNVFRQVLTPSSDGATIVSAKGGATQNFAYKNAAFTYNSASYHVIVKKVR